jgi:very-short-patch-repair endonuclease
MPEEKPHLGDTSPNLWYKLKPLARQMRHEPTAAEDALWQRLRNRKVCDSKFRRQHSIERFIVDFFCEDHRLVIEVDGSIHDYTVEEDAIRQAYLESLGYRVIRFGNDEVFQTIDAVIEQVRGLLR